MEKAGGSIKVGVGGFDICKRKGIPYIGVRRNPSVFEMEPCDILCEDCSKLIDVQVRATESKM